MKKVMLATALLLGLTPAGANAADLGHQTLGSNDGWGAYSTGTTGGSKASSSNVYTVSNRNQLVSALGKDTNTTPKIIYIKGTVDMNVDDNLKPLGLNDYKDPEYDLDKYLKAYDPSTWGKKEPSGTLEEARARSQKNQKARVMVDIPANTTIVGSGTNAKIVGGNFQIKSDNVIIRNIEFQDAYDYFPQWDPTDGSSGNWNSQYDNITINGGTHIWIDHCTFNDGSRPDSTSPKYFGRKYQHHDGQTDASNGANYITMSYNYYHDHDKSSIFGSSDSKTSDDGKLKITLHHNHYKNIVQRAPRVRFGQVHVYNNYYEGSTSSSDYAFSYAWGIGKSSKIYAQNNVIDVPGLPAAKTISVFSGGTALYDSGTLLNGTQISASAANGLSSSVGWTPSLHGTIDASANVKSNVISQAGAGKLN
ncbi:pectate lyase [Bacillus spizizenii]|uniref:Pectate lyase n=1 Tax=Bacillus spizizenii (strain DSM 15029 / JCM 12233 / NBRC 101239 / NRRL B-23049 / TU-B-10) TaxID=1052585 RepID=G4NRE9_BACS4|nr:pectate lyase [Bacillus spizizenii]AEP85699.1 pectate lyase [Bacillus spizizenii TU-B-10]KXJ37544.1 pectate lyase [Bacillus spizizenii]MCI4169331.1 pectate lyase [Bacillus spizizenii]OUL03256.1 pectate lyase [Bacillus spizizenii]GEK26219.1 pectate lyase [Bacillus spizizenii]